MTDTLFLARGADLVPTEHARGPWDPGALHGGPVAALLARALEEERSGSALARIMVELLRPVRFRPLQISVRRVRPGKRVQLDQAVMTCDGDTVAIAHGLRIRAADVEVPFAAPQTLQPGPDDSEHAPILGDGPAFHSTGAELRFAAPRTAGSGRARVWVRLSMPLVQGERPSGFQRAAAAADFGNGVSSPLSFETMVFINPDLTVSVFREPLGEWIGLDATTQLGPKGRGLSDSILFDAGGSFGRSTQSLIVERR
jgi:hypothetical protein